MSLLSRFYEKEYPDIDDVVMVQVNKIDHMGIHVILLEYNNMVGYVAVSALSRKRIRFLSKIVKVGKIMALIVIRVDKNKGYIDLSKRDISDKESKLCDEKYKQAKYLHGIIKSTLISSRYKDNLFDNITLEECLQKTIWPIYETTHHNNPNDVIKKILNSEYKIFDNLENNIFKENLIQNFKQKYKEVCPLVDAYVEIIILSDNAIYDIKKSIDLCVELKEEKSELEITVESSPLYKLNLKSCQDSENALHEMNKILDKLKEEIIKISGSFNLIKEPHIRNENNIFIYEEDLENCDVVIDEE